MSTGFTGFMLILTLTQPGIGRHFLMYRLISDKQALFYYLFSSLITS